MKKVGERVASVRGTLGVAEFADAIGVNRKTIQRWEDGLAMPDGNSLLLLLEKFGVDPSWLLTGNVALLQAEQSRAPYGISIDAADEVALVRAYREIDPAARATLQDLLKVIAGAGHVAQVESRPAVAGAQVPRPPRIKIMSSNLPDRPFSPPEVRGVRKKKGDST